MVIPDDWAIATYAYFLFNIHSQSVHPCGNALTNRQAESTEFAWPSPIPSPVPAPAVKHHKAIQRPNTENQFVREEAQQADFEKLKEAITAAPVLWF